jgi:hypothetical protein
MIFPMAANQPWTGDDARHNDDCHRRWQSHRHRDTASPSYREKWYLQQCGGCRYWIALNGQVGLDYGVCSHAASTFDGQVRFEHDGCNAFTERDDGSFG